MAAPNKMAAVPAMSNVTCAICLENYRRPKLLPCFHTFCQNCLQTLAGTSPSFLCPACRTPVFLPTGGVGALQTNFYIETAPTSVLCDVCNEDREATHTCMQCQKNYCFPCQLVHGIIASTRSHTVFPIAPGNEEDRNSKAEASVNNREEFCLKHRNQYVILHCTQCTANICMQCKLTSHEGHPTEDLAETGGRVKTRLKDYLEKLAQEMRTVEGAMASAKDKRCQLETLRDTTMRNIKERTSKARQLLDVCRDNALLSLQNLNHGLMNTLDGADETLRQEKAKLDAQFDHVTSVLREGRHADMVSLDKHLKEIATGNIDVAQMLKYLTDGSLPYSCRHNPVAINTVLLQDYVGVFESSDNCTSKIGITPGQVSNASAAAVGNGLASTVTPKSVRVSEVVYSKNPKSKIVAMCTTSEGRVWLHYKPSGEGRLMTLFSKAGAVKMAEGAFGSESMVTVLDGITLCSENCKVDDRVPYSIGWLTIDGKTYTNPAKDFFQRFSKHGNKKLFASNSKALYRLSVTSTESLVCNAVQIGRFTDLYLADVSRDEKYFAFLSTHGDLLVYHALFDKLELLTTLYDKEQPILDACFFPIDGREMLLALAVWSEDHKKCSHRSLEIFWSNSIQVLDHTDGCNLVRDLLDTEPVSLNGAYRLATDNETVLWIGCHGGKMVLLEI